MQKENKMGVMPVNRLLVSMSVPIMISMLVQALYNVVDSIFVAQISENALTAVSMAFPVQNLMIAVGSGTGVGINALLSRSLGAREFDKVNKAANNGVFVGIASSAIFIVFGIFGARYFFESQTAIPEIVHYGEEYLLVCCSFSFALLGQMTFERLLQSTGKTIYSMYTQSIGAVVNIVLDAILIFGLFGFPRLEVLGAAIATVIGQGTAMLLALYFNKAKNHEIKFSFKGFKPDSAIIKSIYYVGLPSILMIAISSIMTYGMNRILIGFSATAVAVFGVYFKMQSFVFMPVLGLNNGIVPIIAYNYGAENKERIMKIIKLSILYSVGIMLVGIMAFQFLTENLLYMFSASENMMAIGIPALRTISLSFLLAGVCIVLISVFQALGRSMKSLIVSASRQLAVLLPAAYLLSLSGSLEAIWWAFPIAEVVSFILCIIFMKQVYDQTIKKLDHTVLRRELSEVNVN